MPCKLALVATIKRNKIFTIPFCSNKRNSWSGKGDRPFLPDKEEEVDT